MDTDSCFEDQEATTSSVTSLRVWPQLLPELAERIGSFMSRNERACTLRLVNKAAAALFTGPQHTTVRLSQPVPPQAFMHRWGAPGAARGLPYRQRLQLLCLTAASGSIPNMQVALEAAGCTLTCEMASAAAAAGQLEMCEWLMKHGCPCDTTVASAAGAGQLAMCEWLLRRGCPCGDALTAAAAAGQRQACELLVARTSIGPDEFSLSPWAAARGGHVDLMEWIMRERPDDSALLDYRTERLELLVAVAHGCDLATLQRLHRQWLEAPGGAAEPAGQQPGGQADEPEPDELDLETKEAFVASAAASPTSDWRAKVEWLESRGYPRTTSGCTCAATCSDALERLAWLRGRGYECEAGASASAAGTGNLAALQYLHAEGVLAADDAAESAAKSGHLPLVTWLVETPGVGVELNDRLFGAAAASGSLELMAWLHERGCPWGEQTFTAAAAGGNELALEWLAERGCPFGEGGEPLCEASSNGDTATLRCLVRLGCPWGLANEVLCRTVDSCVIPAMVRELLEAGCPVEWEGLQTSVWRSHMEFERSHGTERTWAWKDIMRMRRGIVVETLALLAQERAKREQRASGLPGGLRVGPGVRSRRTSLP